MGLLNIPISAVTLLGEEELFQLDEIGWRDVRDRAEREAILLPGEPVVALRFAGATPVIFRLGFFDEDIDDVLAARVDEGRDGATTGYVKSAPDQGEAIACKIAHGRREIDAPVKPGLDRVLVGGLDVSEMAGLQGAEMRIHERSGHELSLVRAPGDLQLSPANQHCKKNDCCRG